MNKKLFITDLDGTLLTKDGKLDAKVASRLNELIRQGEHITFVTGRDLTDAEKIMGAVQLDIPYAVYNGSAIYDPCKKKLLHYWSLPSKQVKKLSGELNKYANANITFVENNEIRKEKFCLKIIDKYSILSVSVRDKKSIIDSIHERIVDKCDNSKMLIQKYSDPENDKAYIIDITSSYVDKGVAAKYIASLLGFLGQDIVAFGNDSNDISLSCIAGQFYLVGNAEQKSFENIKSRIPFNGGVTVVDCIDDNVNKKHKEFKIPEVGWESEKVLSYLEPGKSSRAPGGRFMGYPQTTPHPMALIAYKKFLPYNTNQIGVFSNINDLGSKTRKMEYEVINMLGELYGINEPDGYLTSGGTEGNIVGIWTGRNLLSKSVGKLYIVKTELTHSSVSKAANILNLPEVIVEYDERFSMDLKDLKEKLKTISSSNTGIILVATLGYTNTGTCDDIFAISDILTEIEKLCGTKSYIHIDASIGGFVYPFIDYEPINFFSKKNVWSITIDPHKMGYLPFSCGVFIGRKDLLLNIETKCTYSRKHRERTLIGSRNGAVAAACWSTLMNMGVNGYKSTLATLIENKNYILQQLVKEKLVKVISNPPTNMCTIQFNKCHEKRLPAYLEEKYATHAFILKVDNIEQCCYRIYIMPHLDHNVINEFIEDIKRIGECK